MSDTTIEYTAEQRIRFALGRMPYLPLVSGYSKEPDLESLARTLEGLADVLTLIGDENRQREEELRALKSDLAAFRRVLGTELLVQVAEERREGAREALRR